MFITKNMELLEVIAMVLGARILWLVTRCPCVIEGMWEVEELRLALLIGVIGWTLVEGFCHTLDEKVTEEELEAELSDWDPEGWEDAESETGSSADLSQSE